MKKKIWGDRRGLNPQHPESQSGALPIELRSPSILEITPNEPANQAPKANFSYLGAVILALFFAAIVTAPFWWQSRQGWVRQIGPVNPIVLAR